MQFLPARCSRTGNRSPLLMLALVVSFHVTAGLRIRRRLLWRAHIAVHPMHLSHFHFCRSDSQKKPPRNRMVAVKLIEYSRLRIERYVTANSHRHLIRIPDVPCPAKGVGTDAEARMLLRDPQTSTFSGPQQIVLIHQLQSRVEIVLVQEIDGRFSRVTVQVTDFSWTIQVIAAQMMLVAQLPRLNGRL